MESKTSAGDGTFWTNPILYLYHILESILIYLFAPNPPKPNLPLTGPKIAIIGAGITGVSSAAHCVGHGCDVVIFDKHHETGGIWSKVNSTSGLQIHSIMYRFHPAVKYNSAYPHRDSILEQVRNIWEMYGLREKTRFEYTVDTVERSGDKWIINGHHEEPFDGVIAAVGTCDQPKMPHLTGIEKFQGQVVHSSHLDGLDIQGKNVSIIGGGASAVEALENAISNGAGKINILSRSDKWIIPRNPVVDALLSLNVFGYETIFSFIPEFLLRKFFYRDLKDLSPADGTGLFESTPMVNDQILDQIRQGKASWLRGDIIDFDNHVIKYIHRAPGVPKGGVGHHIDVPTDIIVQATGFHRPPLTFLPQDTFTEPYNPPNWYLQVFPPSAHGTICATNCTYVNAIGTVGHFHIGIYTRIMLMFLMDPLTRPPEKYMKVWIDMTRWLKRRAPTGAFDFFSYGELIWWYVFVCVVNPFRWKWAAFILFGWGQGFGEKVVRKEEEYWDERKSVKNGPW